MSKKEKKAKKEEETEEKKEGEAAPEGEAGAEGEVAEGGKSKKKLIIIVVGIVILLLAIAGGAFFFLGHKGEHKEGEAAKGSSEAGSESKGEGEAKVAKPVYFDLPGILVNLNTNGKQTSFIKASVTLELGSNEDVPVLQANLPRLMDSYNTFLREMRASDLYGSAGIYRLREEMLSRANTILAPVQVHDVLFRELLIQ